jgi:DNA polymerase-3 subunit alpha
MAAVLSNNMSDIKQVSLWRKKANGTEVLGPDVNESHYKFTNIIMQGAFWSD